MLCSTCNHQNRDSVRFCESCGSQLETPCPSCGAVGPPKRRFCGDCGQRLDGKSDATAGSATRHSGERRHMTVLFCDLVGSTSLSQGMDAEEFRDVVRSYSEKAHAAISRYGGYVARYMGDGLLCYFGYPRAFEDNAERSIRAGLDVVSAVAEISTQDGRKLETRVGIASGEVITGETVRPDAGFETLAIGDTPNLAARVQSFASPGDVVIADGTRRLVKEPFELEDLGEHTLKGFSDPQRLWKVAPPLAQNIGFVPGAGRPDGEPIYDRDDEMAILERRWQRAVSGDMQIAHIIGEPGIGKTRLLLSFLEHLDAEQHTVVPLRCSSMGSDSVMFPITRYIGNAIGLSALPENERFAALEHRIRDVVDADEVSVACLAGLLGINAGRGDPGVDELTPSQQQHRILRLLTRWITGLARLRAVLLVAEDVHWMDATTYAWLNELSAEARDARIFLVLTSRPGFVQGTDFGPGLLTVTLGHLSRSGCASIITRVTGGKPLPDEVVDMILRKTDGVPLFVEELTRSLLDSNSLSLEGDRYQVSEPLDRLGVPSTLQDSLMSRLDRAPWIRDVAQTASVIGREFTEQLLTEVIGRHRDTVETALVELERSGLLRRRIGQRIPTWEFKHALVRDAAYQNTLKAQRKVLHGIVADAIERLGPDVRSTQPELLAYHYSEAARPAAAAELWQEAGRRARNAWANQEAVRHFRRALESLAEAPPTEISHQRECTLQLELADALRAARGSSSAEASSAYARAANLCSDTGDIDLRLRARYGEFVTHFMSARLGAALEPARQLLETGDQLNHLASRVAGHQAMGMHAFATGQFESARRHFDAALAAVEEPELGKNSIQYPALSRCYLSWTMHLLGEDEQAGRISDLAIDEARKASSYDFALTLSNACYLYQFRGDSERVGQLAEEVIQLATERDLPAWGDVASFFKTWAACRESADAEILKRLRDALGRFSTEEIETPYFQSIVAETLMRHGNRQQGLALLDDAQKLMARTGETWFLPRLRLIREAGRSAG